jgi:hypothetical protein
VTADAEKIPETVVTTVKATPFAEADQSCIVVQPNSEAEKDLQCNESAILETSYHSEDDNNAGIVTQPTLPIRLTLFNNF